VVVMQRCHEQDLTGHILDSEPGEWRHVCLPARYEVGSGAEYDPRSEEGAALWPEMYPTPALDLQQATMDPYAVAGQYQQRPTGRKGGLFDISNFRTIDAVPAGAMVIRAWDFASTEGAGDWTVGARLSETEDGRVFIEHSERGQGAGDRVESVVRLTAGADGVGIPVCIPADPGSAGKSLALSYATRALRGFSVFTRAPSKSKTTRAEPLASQLRAGNVYLVRGDWNAALLAEFKMFPRGRHDDIVDACADAYAELVAGHGGGGGSLTKEDYSRFRENHVEDPLARKETTDRRGSTGTRWSRKRT